MVVDRFSRWSVDRQDYQLDPEIFKMILENFRGHIFPEIDMFASPGNAQLDKFVSRWPHWQAWGVDALQMDLSQVKTCYANPPGH